jgi:hypothetical protein
MRISKALLSEYFSSIGRKGGRLGGRARANNLTPKQRSDAARAAVQARWKKVQKAERTRTRRRSTR